MFRTARDIGLRLRGWLRHLAAERGFSRGRPARKGRIGRPSGITVRRRRDRRAGYRRIAREENDIQLIVAPSEPVAALAVVVTTAPLTIFSALVWFAPQSPAGFLPLLVGVGLLYALVRASRAALTPTRITIDRHRLSVVGPATARAATLDLREVEGLRVVVHRDGLEGVSRADVVADFANGSALVIRQWSERRASYIAHRIAKARERVRA